MKYIGAHVSAAGGVENAPLNAQKIGANAFALFTRNQRQWNSKPLEESSIEKFQENCRSLGFSADFILPHDSYLINLGSPDPEMLKKSRLAFYDEMKRCEVLGLNYLNFHPGAHLNKMSEQECFELIAESINVTLDQTERVVAVVEVTAGQGSNVGYQFEHIKAIIDLIEPQTRAGVCVDTAHIYAAGYDLTSRGAFEETFQLFNSIIGLDLLKGIHLNDSKKDLGSRVDRHAPLGEGTLGWEPFKWIMTDDRFDNIPIILETPEPERWPQEIEKLKQFAEGEG